MNLLAKKVVKLLTKKKLSLSAAESCSGGLFSHTITKVPGASKIFLFSFITYSNISKNKILKVSNYKINKFGSVSKQTCLSMLNGLSKISKTDICVAVTGIAGPGGGSILKPVGLVYLGVKFKGKKICKKIFIKNKSRVFIQKESTRKVLQLIYNLVN